MLGLISHLQRKPEHARKKIAFATSLVMTGVIVLFWLVSLSFQRSDTSVATQTKEEAGPFQAVTESVGTFFADVGTAFQNMKNTFSNVPTEVKASAQADETAPTASGYPQQ